MPSMIMLTDHGKVLPAQRMEWMGDDHVEAWIPSRTLTRIARLARIRNRRAQALDLQDRRYQLSAYVGRKPPKGPVVASAHRGAGDGKSAYCEVCLVLLSRAQVAIRLVVA